MSLKLHSFVLSACCLSLLCAGVLLHTSFADDKNDINKPAQTGAIENGNVVIGPEYQIDPDLTDKGNPKGKNFTFTMALADSKIFRGDDSTLTKRRWIRTERKIFVYVPAAYKDGTKAPVLVTLDGPSNLNLVRRALDNLTISRDPARRLPAFIAIAVENGGNDGKGAERGLEYDTMSDRLPDSSTTRCCPPSSTTSRDQGGLSPPRLHRRSLGPRRHGLQLRRGGGDDHGVVSARPVPPPDHATPARLWISRTTTRRRKRLTRWAPGSTTPARSSIENSRQEAAADLHPRLGERPPRQGPGRDLSQLGHGQPAHGRGPQGQGLQPSLRLQPMPGTATAKSSTTLWPIPWSGSGAIRGRITRNVRSPTVNAPDY